MVDYAFYKNQYGGTKVSLADFGRLSLKAKSSIDFLTFGRIDWKKGEDTAKICLCEVLDCIYEYEAVESGKAVKSESLGQYSVTYSDSALSSSYNEVVYGIVARYYLHTGLMYRGV